jgi:23S rRNA (cytidine1920-2'-O)/16S rRNA (cytidine1409-2'-O)-methyltransferase
MMVVGCHFLQLVTKNTFLKNKRLDVLVLEKGFFQSREAVRTAIMSGAILINGQKSTKPGASVPADAKIEIVESYTKAKFVSRGGLKLELALQKFEINPQGRICLDIGASTGGFTDCLLQAGARKVYAIDVGYGQLSWHLRQDKRVVCIERFNARNMNPDSIYREKTDWADLSVIDVSFISLEKILVPVFSTMRRENAEAICLIKPQFEIGREKVGKGGVVRTAEDHISVLNQVQEQMTALGLTMKDLTFSPIKGPAGNIEFLAHVMKTNSDDTVQAHELTFTASSMTAPTNAVTKEIIQGTVKSAHASLSKTEHD